MKRVLVLSWYPASGSDSGERIRLKNLLESLSNHSSVTLFSFADDRVTEPENHYIDVRSKTVISYKFRRVDLFRALLLKKSIQDIRLSGSSKARKDLSDFLEKNTFDVIIANQLPVMGLLFSINHYGNPRIILDTHNAEGLRMERAARESKSLLRYVFKSQADAVRNLEERASKSCDLILAVTREDYLYFSNLGARDILIVPNGSHNRYHNNPYSLRENYDFINLVYVGSLSYSANRNGLLKFLTDYRNMNCDVSWKLIIAGSGAPKSFIRRIQKYSNVFYKGYVKNSEEFLLSGDAMLVPLWLGGGSRLKIFEGFSLGIPVIATKVGIEGIDAIDGEHYFEFNSPDDLAKILNQFSHSDVILKIVSNNAFKLSSEYSWKTRFTPLIEYIKCISSNK